MGPEYLAKVDEAYTATGEANSMALSSVLARAAVLRESFSDEESIEGRSAIVDAGDSAYSRIHTILQSFWNSDARGSLGPRVNIKTLKPVSAIGDVEYHVRTLDAEGYPPLVLLSNGSAVKDPSGRNGYGLELMRPINAGNPLFLQGFRIGGSRRNRSDMVSSAGFMIAPRLIMSETGLEAWLDQGLPDPRGNHPDDSPHTVNDSIFTTACWLEDVDTLERICQATSLPVPELAVDQVSAGLSLPAQ